VYSTLQAPPEPPRDLPEEITPHTTTACQEYNPTPHRSSIKRTSSSPSHPKRRGVRFNRSISPPTHHKQLRPTPIPTRRAYAINVTDQKHYSIADSGANISVIHPDTAARLNLTPQPWPKPFDITFGNNSKHRCTHFVDFGPILGQVALVDNAPDTLISIGALLDRGYETRFNSDLGVGIYYQGQLLHQGRRNPTTNLFELDICELSQLPPIHHPATPALVHSNKHGLLDQALIRDVLWLHKRLGHPSREDMATALLHSTWTGLNPKLTPACINKVLSRINCTACGLTKRNRQPIGSGSGVHGNLPAETLSVDYQGPIHPTSGRGYTGFFFFKDLFSGYRHAIFVKDKSGESFLAAATEVITFYKYHGHSVSHIRCDAGSSENASDVGASLLQEHNIIMLPASPGHQHQNPVEREVQTLIKGVSCLLLDQNSLGPTWWDYAVESWIQTANCRPHKNEWMALPSSPLEIITGSPPDVGTSFRFPFGCPVSTIPPTDRPWKYGPNAEFGIAVGSSPHNNGSTLVFIPGKGIKPRERMDVTLLKVPTLPTAPKQHHPTPPPTTPQGSISFTTNNPILDAATDSNPVTQRGTLGHSLFQEASAAAPPEETHISSTPADPPPPPPSPPAEDPFITRFGEPRGPVPRVLRDRPPKPPKFLKTSNRTIAIAFSARQERIAMATKRTPRTRANPTLHQAKSLDDWHNWLAAIRAELTMLRDMGCYDTVDLSQVGIDPRTGRRYQIIPTKMDLKMKYDAMGNPTKYKGRLVVLGDQEWGDTLRDVFAPTVNSKTINILLAIAAQQGLHLYGLDIFGAFITADIDQPVYVQLPKGLNPDDPEDQPIWKLRRTLYGLKRAPKAFYDQLTAFLLSKGYSRSVNDPCLFFRLFPNGDRIYFCIHVDDFAIAASDPTLINDLCDSLREKYTITESDNLESFLGIHIVKEDDRLYLSQPGHIAKCAATAEVDSTSKPCYIPMAPTFNDSDQDQSPPADKKKYATLLGMLIYVLRTRPDVAYSVNRLATRSSAPTLKDYECLRQVANYLYTTSHLELVYNSQDPSQRKTVGKLIACSDAAFLTHADSKSHSGINFALGENTGVFHARSQKQKMVTLSSTEAEVYAAIECTKDIVHFREILKELGFEQLQPTTLYMDNKSAITLGQDMTCEHKKARHYMARLQYLIEKVQQQVVKLEHLDGTRLPADVLSKAKPRSGHEQNTASLMGPQRPGAEDRSLQTRTSKAAEPPS